MVAPLYNLIRSLILIDLIAAALSVVFGGVVFIWSRVIRGAEARSATGRLRVDAAIRRASRPA
jgi:hypothetical protein